MIFLYYKKKQYKLHYFPTKENQGLVSLIEPLLHKYQPAIHIPVMIQLLLNSHDVDAHQTSTTPLNTTSEK